MTACAVAARCRRVVSGGDCVACGGRSRDGTGIAGAASYVPASTRPAPVCAGCGGPLDGPGAKPHAWLKPGVGAVQGCGRSPECRSESSGDIPPALAAAIVDGLIPDIVPLDAGIVEHLKAWARREMAMLTAGVGIKHREKWNP